MEGALEYPKKSNTWGWLEKQGGGQKVSKNAVETLFIRIVDKKISWPVLVLKLFLF